MIHFAAHLRRRTTAAFLVVVPLAARAAGTLAAEATPSATAAPRPAGGEVSLDLRGCPAADAGEVRRILAIELRAPVALVSEAGATRDVALGISCDAAAAHVRMDDQLTGKQLLRDVDISATAAIALDRLIALAGAELISASWAELMLAPPRAAAGDPAASGAREQALAVVRERATDQRRTRLFLLARAGASPGRGLALGGGLAVSRDFATRLRGAVDATFDRRAQTAPPGAITAELASVGLSLAVRLPVRAWELGAGAGARVGVARLAGTPADGTSLLGHSLTAPTWGPLAMVRATSPARRALVLELALEVGYTVLPVRGTFGADELVALQGPWIGGTLGVGFAL